MSRRLLQSILWCLVPVVPCAAQPEGDGNPAARMQRAFEKKAPKVGARVPDVSLFDSRGRPVRLRALKEHYTVLVFGCLT